MDNRYLYIKLTVNGVDLNPVDYAYGHVGLPAIYGFGSLLQRHFSHEGLISTVSGFAMSTYRQRLFVVEGQGLVKFCLPRTAHFMKGANLNEGVPRTEECKCYGVYGLVFEIQDFQDEILDIAKEKLPQMRFAGGTIERVLDKDVDVFLQEEEDEQRLKKWLMPGTITLDRHELLASYCKVNGCDSLDALLDHLSFIDPSEEESEESGTNDKKKEEKKRVRKSGAAGWLIPVFAGYQRIYDWGKNLEGQRNKNYKHTFVEPVVTLAECVLPSRVSRVNDMLWQLIVDEGQNYFLFQQKNKEI